MLSLTRHERYALFAFIAIVLIGAWLDYMLKHYPKFMNTMDWIKENQQALRVDLNQATLEDLVNIPGIGEVTAQRIVDYRHQQGAFSQLDQLKNIKGIGLKRFQELVPYFKITPTPIPPYRGGSRSGL